MKNMTMELHLSVIEFAGLLLVFSYLAGVLGALTGLGGGIIVIPVLVLIFHIDIHYAMGASLISVIATSSGAAAAYLRDGYTNLRLGMFLEVAAVIGAFAGALLITIFSKAMIAIIFSIVILISAFMTVTRNEEHEQQANAHPLANILQLNGKYPYHGKFRGYCVQRVPLGFILLGIGGALSGLLGIGAGIVKVIALDSAMQLPYKVATTTSNFMIGMTAAVSAGIYFMHGYIIPTIAFPVLIGVVFGAFTGAKLLNRINTQALRIIFSITISIVALQLMYEAITGAV